MIYQPASQPASQPAQKSCQPPPQQPLIQQVADDRTLQRAYTWLQAHSPAILPHWDTLKPQWSIEHSVVKLARWSSPLYLGFALLFPLSAFAASIAADWTSITGMVTAAGTLNGVNVTVTGDFGSSPGPGSGDFSKSDYSAAPLSTNQSYIGFLPSTALNFTFGSPVSNLSVYLYSWRGNSGSCSGTPAGVYTFGTTPTIASGVAGSSLSGNDLSLFGNFQSGIVTFAGPLTSLTVSAGCGSAGGLAGFTLSVPAPPTAPSGLTATAVSQTQIDLLWTDNSSNETGFKIFRDTVELTPSPKVGANTTATATFSDTGLTCGTTYNYEVKATSAAGDSTGAIAGPTTTSACPIPQTIIFTPPTSATVGDAPLTLTATGGASGNPVTFASTTPSVCTVDSATLTAVSVGTCTVTADQAGLGNYVAASQVSKNISVVEKSTTVSVYTPLLPNQMALLVQVDGTGSGNVSTDTGLYCTREDCPTNPNGEVVCKKEACTDIIDTGALVTLTPQADSGSVFTSWGGHEDCADGEILNFGRLCIAFFQKVYDLTVILSGQGKITGNNSINQLQGIDCGEGATSCSQSFSHGTSTYLQATPATGMNFLGWGGDCEGLRNPLAVKVVKEMACEAQFGTVELPPVVVISEPVVPLVPAEASTPTGEASTPAVPLVPAEASTPKGEASTPTGEVSTPVVPLVPAEASTPVGTLVPAEASTPEVSTPVVPLVPAEASTPTAEASTPVAEVSTPVVPVIPIAALILGGASSSCETTGSINLVCNYGGRPVTELDIQGQGMVSNGVLSNNLVNIGWVSNFTITVKGKLTGGVVTGYIKNFGVMLDFDFKGMSIIGGTLGGVITNTSKVGGFFQDVTLLAGTKIIGGTLKGTIKGDKKSPAVLEKVRIKKGSKLSGVKLGKKVKLEKGVVVE